jgi:signal peptide peptidase SppA
MNLLLDALSQPWALERSVFGALTDVFERHASGIRLSVEEVQAIQNPANRQPSAGMEISGDVAIIPIRGVIARHSSLVNGASQPTGTAVDSIRADFRAALADSRVSTIAFDVDSPGGMVAGVADLADEIRASTKPTTAYTDGMMASAAYWLVSGVDQIFASRTAQVGSIGVYTSLEDSSIENHMKGRRRIVVASGRYKGAGEPGRAIDAEMVQETKSKIDEFFGMFRESVIAGRGFSADQMNAVADGQVFIGQKALEKGLIDAIESEPQFRSRLTNPSQGERAMSEPIVQAAAAVAATPTIPSASAAPVAAALPVAPATPAPADPVVVERARVVALNGLAEKWPSFSGIITTAIAMGSSVESAQAAINDALHLQRGAQLVQQNAAAAAPAAQAAAAAAVGGNAADPAPTSFNAEDVKARFEAGEFRGRYNTVEAALRWEKAAFESAQPKRA